MGGHAAINCECAVCRCVARILSLLDQGTGLPFFVDGVATRLRVVEAEARDELARRGWREGSLAAPIPAPGAAPGGGTATPANGPPGAAAECKAAAPAPREEAALASQAAKKVAATEPGESVAPTSQPVASDCAERTPEEVNLGIYLKSCPAAPRVPAAGAQQVKLEAEIKAKPPKEEEKEGEAKRSEAKEESRKRRDASRSRRRQHRRSRSRRRTSGERARGSRDHRSDRSRERRRRESSVTPRSAPGKEKKSRPERPPEPAGPPPRREDRRVPREPDHPPPARSSGSGRAQGPGWQGPIPYSSHARWSVGKSKGIVRRAKQERFNRRRDRRHDRGGCRRR